MISGQLWVAMDRTSNTAWAHLILAGAGVLSLSYAGALTVLHERGIRFRSVSSCSAGTLIGALLCARGTPEGLIKDVQNFSLTRLKGRRASPLPWLFSVHPLFKWPFALYRSPGFSEAFRDRIGGDPTFKDLKIHFAVAAFDIVQRRFLVYASDSHPEMKVSEALAVAVSIPLAYPPHERDGRVVLDAGIASECPVWMAADQDPALPIVALRTLRNPRPGRRPSTIDAYLSETLGSATSGLDDYIISQMPRVKLVEIDCADIRGSQFDLNPHQRERLIDAGRRAAEDALQRFGHDLSKVCESRTNSLLGGANDAKAMEHGITLMTRFHQDLSKEVSNRVFISYCHEDKAWFDKVKKQFEAAFPISSTWDDTRIEPGEQWEKEIETALKASTVAILLLSPQFFMSKYITERELPAIIDASNKGKIKPIPLFISADETRWMASPVSKIQPVNADRPMDTLSEGERIALLKTVANQIKREIQIA